MFSAWLLVGQCALLRNVGAIREKRQQVSDFIDVTRVQPVRIDCQSRSFHQFSPSVFALFDNGGRSCEEQLKFLIRKQHRTKLILLNFIYFIISSQLLCTAKSSGTFAISPIWLNQQRQWKQIAIFSLFPLSYMQQ